MVSYAPTSSGVMRGWLGTATNPETHRLWFVLSSETLSYYESEEATDPLGMLGIDEMSSVKASKKSHKQYHMTISLTDERFERRLEQCAAEVAAARRSAGTEAAAAADGPSGGEALPETPGQLSRTRLSATGTTLAATTQLPRASDVESPTTLEGMRSLSTVSASGSLPSPQSPSRSWWQRWFGGGATEDGDQAAVPRSTGPAQLVLVASTPFEADAWSAAIKEAQSALVANAQAQHWPLVCALAQAGRDVNTREAGNQRTALHYAAGYGEVRTARALVQLGAAVNARDRAGMTPLGWACLKGRVELAQVLLKANADPLIKAHSGVLVNKSAIALARLHGSQSQSAARRAQELVHNLLMHSGAAWFQVHARDAQEQAACPTRRPPNPLSLRSFPPLSTCCHVEIGPRSSEISPPLNLLPPHHLGAQVHNVLGQGGFGKVLAVTRSDSGERFAMKSILKHGSASASTNMKMIKQAQVERRILRRVNHPFIVDLHCAFQTHDKLLLVLEICSGGDLKSHISRCGRFPPEVAAFCGAQVLLALEYLHTHAIVHRDIKLENILLDGDGYVRLTDFNVAKLLEERRTFSMKGTLFCMAPEVIQKKGHDTAADFWSYGVLIYELLTGGPPFYSSDKQELKRQILGMSPRHFHVAFPPDMPTACRMLLQQLIVREPKLRLGARRQDVAIMKAHPFFGRLDWDRLLAKQLPSPLKQSVEAIAQSRLQKASRNPIPTVDGEFAPSYLSRQSSALVEDWDYVAPV